GQGRALEVAMHFGIFEKLVCIDHGTECFTRHEMIVAALAFARTRRSRGVRNGKADARLALQQRVDQRGLARTRRRGDHEQRASKTVGRGAHSMFCTCSRICSIRTLSSTAALVERVFTDLEPSVLA